LGASFSAAGLAMMLDSTFFEHGWCRFHMARHWPCGSGEGLTAARRAVTAPALRIGCAVSAPGLAASMRSKMTKSAASSAARRLPAARSTSSAPSRTSGVFAWDRVQVSVTEPKRLFAEILRLIGQLLTPLDHAPA